MGAGGRGCNPWGQGPAFERPVVQFQGLGVALGSHRDPVGSGSSPVCASGEGRFDSPEPQVRNVTARCPPAAEPGGAGRGHLRTLAAPHALLRVHCSPARALPTGSLLPTPTPRRRAGSSALTGLRRPRASRGVHGASGPASPAAAPPRKWTPAAGPGRPGPPLVQCRPDGRSTSGADAQASGALRAARLQHPQAPPPPQSQARTGLRGHRAGPGHPARASRTGARCSFNPHQILRTRCHLCFAGAVRGRLDYFPPWYKNCLMQ